MSIYVPGKVVLAQQQKIPVVIGEPWGGGYFAGYISHTADGNPTHALIVAPRETGATGAGGYTLTTDLAWKTTNTATVGAASLFDGVVNTAAMIADDVSTGVQNHPAAQFCVNLDIGGFTDWYLPARYELDIAYFNLKPSTSLNDANYGINDYSVPKRTINNTASYPTQTSISAFNTSVEAFLANDHWSSTQSFMQRFNTGLQASIIRTAPFRVRAFRRIEL
jgi:hypothetical protein